MHISFTALPLFFDAKLQVGSKMGYLLTSGRDADQQTGRRHSGGQHEAGRGHIRGGIEKRVLQNEFITHKIGNDDSSGTAHCQHGGNKI
ncbi:hypothetical protein MC885_016149 [Smutsia gigantea]|nr:hypothetical protein MC885_016149 [Smutsia gigantea]